jgi:hypothetical protein
MRKSRPPDRRAARCITGLIGAAWIALAGCAAPGLRTAAPLPSPEAVFQAVLGRNAGLSAVRAVVEAELSYAGREISLPGVLQLDGLDGFRLDLLDPLDRPIAIFYAEQGRIVQYRPGLQLGASLGVFSEACRGIGPADWVQAVIAGNGSPHAGEKLLDRPSWGRDRNLEIHRGGELRRSIRYRFAAGQAIPLAVSWYCGDDVIMKLRFREWLAGAPWRLPTRLEIEYPQSGLHVRLELREIEGNPSRSAGPLLPRPDSSTRWTTWDLPR